MSELQKSATRHDGDIGFKCPYCRQFTRTKDVSFVVTKQKNCEGFDSDVPLIGSFSTKVEAVIRRINWIHSQVMIVFIRKGGGQNVLILPSGFASNFAVLSWFNFTRIDVTQFWLNFLISLF